MHYNPSAKKIGAKFLKIKDYCKELLLSHGVVILGFIKGFASIVNGMKDFVPSLSQYHTKSNPTRITHHLKRLAPIRRNDDRCRHQLFFQLTKFLKTGFMKIKFTLFLKQLAQRMRNFLKILDEPPVKTCMPKKASHTFDRETWGKSLYYLDFSSINLYTLL